MSRHLAIWLARLRVPATVAVLILLLLDARFRVVPLPWILVWFAATALILLVLRAGSLSREPVTLHVPVTGRWRAHNSPASRVPSHGIQSHGQTYAIDLVAEPADLARPRFGWWPLARRARDFPGFGMPVYAPCDGTVVRVHHRERDHWSRTSPFGLLYMFTVELLRDLFGPSRVLGNHAIIKDADGDYVVLAHLRRGSVPVHEGQHIAAGDRVGECGNSGNSSEPHLHLQVMEHPNPLFAAGVPFRFVSDDGAVIQTPVNGDVLSTPES